MGEVRERYPYANFRSLWADMPAEAKAFGSYEEAYAHGVAPWNQLPVATDLLALAPLPGPGSPRLLDVGCGSGHNLRLIEQLGFRCWGIDVSSTAIAEARAKASHPESFMAGSVTALPFNVLSIRALQATSPAGPRSPARHPFAPDASAVATGAPARWAATLPRRGR